MSIGFLQRQPSPSGPLFVIPCSVQTAIEYELANDPEQSESILKLYLTLIATFQGDIGRESIEDVSKCIKTTIVTFRNLCEAARDMSVVVPDDTEMYLLLAAVHYIAQTMKEGQKLFKKHF